MLGRDALGIAGHHVGDRPFERRPVVVGDNASQITIGEDAADPAGGVNENYRPTASLDAADFMQDLADGDLLPTEIEGIPVDVGVTGRITPMGK